ncbi:MAG TPA: type II toxin-antitoxin system RelE/ParE family toxin [Thermodesulfobacteriota bacterium]|nr:type II toxin-antitoxin system RelE/ParE family toxin [Thermodesulfobacteriota bacterium]
MYKVILHKNAAKYYRNADKKLQDRINTAVDIILENPRYHVHIKKLEGELKDMDRYRLGNLRILYEVHEDIKSIRIKAIEARGSVYR